MNCGTNKEAEATLGLAAITIFANAILLLGFNHWLFASLQAVPLYLIFRLERIIRIKEGT